MLEKIFSKSNNPFLYLLNFTKFQCVYGRVFLISTRTWVGVFNFNAYMGWGIFVFLNKGLLNFNSGVKG